MGSGHVQIGGDLEDFLTDGLAEHLVQAGQVGIPAVAVEIRLNGGKLIQGAGKVDVREKSLHLGFRHAAVHQGLDLSQQRHVFRQRALVHLTGQLVQLRQELLLFRVGFGGAVLPEQLCQVADLRPRGLDIRFFPYRRNDLGEELRVFQRVCPSSGVVPLVQRVDGDLFLGFVVHQLNDGVFRIVLFVQFRVQRGQPLGGGDHGVLIHIV